MDDPGAVGVGDRLGEFQRDAAASAAAAVRSSVIGQRPAVRAHREVRQSADPPALEDLHDPWCWRWAAARPPRETAVRRFSRRAPASTIFAATVRLSDCARLVHHAHAAAPSRSRTRTLEPPAASQARSLGRIGIGRGVCRKGDGPAVRRRRADANGRVVGTVGHGVTSRTNPAIIRDPLQGSTAAPL